MSAAYVRIDEAAWSKLEALLVSRYPHEEWASFFRFGWRLIGEELWISVSALMPPEDDDLDREAGNVVMREQYSLGLALAAEKDRLGIGFIHSHPQGFEPKPSWIDDDMDRYYVEYFASFAPNRPYLSLIYSGDRHGHVRVGGRAWFGGAQFRVERTEVVGRRIKRLVEAREQETGTFDRASVAPVISAYGERAAVRLEQSTVCIVGVGGTGSAAAHVLARAGVGRLVLIDFDALEARNLERVHGSTRAQLDHAPKKVELVREMCKTIRPEIEVIAIEGNCLQDLAIDWLVSSNLVIGCTDSLHSRVGLSELAYRYLVPVLDVGVQLGGGSGAITAEVMQFTQYFPGSPCIYCRDAVDPRRLSQELMDPSERQERRRQAEEADERGGDRNMYWHGEPQILTVGHLTTAAAAIAASYAIGILTERFGPPSSFFQCDLLADGLGYVPVELEPRPGCTCQRMRGFGDQGAEESIISAPKHLRPARQLP